MFRDISRIKKGKTKRKSSYDVTGKNNDAWNIEPGESRILADIKGPGLITHIWMTQRNHYRDVLIKITWDNAEAPSILCPLGDFFCLGHGIVNSFQSMFFTASTSNNNHFETGCALNCYLPMPFKKRALIELINESKEQHRQYFYVDYELYENIADLDADSGYLHAEFHRENPFGGWAHEIRVNTPEADILNKEKTAWNNNLVILDTKGKGHYVGCNYSVTNFQGTWWGEGDDMIWVDGYKWPPDLHGTGSEDYLNQAWGMQDNAFLRNGSSIYEHNTGGYQTSYIFHLENPVRFNNEIKVTIEFGHGNHLRNETATVAYWYADKPYAAKKPPSVEKRRAIQKENDKWVIDEDSKTTSREISLNNEMNLMKDRWKQKSFNKYIYVCGKIIENEEGLLCMKMKLSPDNPNLYEVPFSEILEDFQNDTVVVETIPKTAMRDNGDIRTPDIQKLLHLPAPKQLVKGEILLREDKVFVFAGNSEIELKKKLKNTIDKKAELEVLQAFNESLINEEITYRIQIRFE
ncbi:MAG: DUF2961 domain-containing protein [Candidatus Lokiarchaeota archaeon]|nr:DUF2961 domain-containing protein [Candidatus Lokiarchaeota archaeon]